MKHVLLSLAATRDLEEIDEFTTREFGLVRAAKTRLAFETAFATLLAMPLVGRVRPDLSPPGRPLHFFTVMKRFEIVYEQSDRGIQVARVLHGSRDVGSVLNS